MSKRAVHSVQVFSRSNYFFSINHNNCKRSISLSIHRSISKIFHSYHFLQVNNCHPSLERQSSSDKTMQDIWSLTFNVLLVASAFVFSLPQQKQGCVSNSGEICIKYIQFALLWCIISIIMFMFMISQNAVQRVVNKLLLNNYNYSILYIVDTICIM